MVAVKSLEQQISIEITESKHIMEQTFAIAMVVFVDFDFEQLVGTSVN